MQGWRILLQLIWIRCLLYHYHWHTSFTSDVDQWCKFCFSTIMNSFWPNSFLLHSISGPLYIRECCWGQECCKKGIAADAWITANWYPCCWNHYPSNSPEGNPPYQTCNASSSWTQWTGLIFFLLRNCKFVMFHLHYVQISQNWCVCFYNRWFCWVLHQILAYKVTLQI